MSYYICLAQLDSVDRKKTKARWTVFSSGNPRDAVIRRGPRDPIIYYVGDENVAELVEGTFYDEVLASRGIKHQDNKFYLEPNEDYLLDILSDLVKLENAEFFRNSSKEPTTGETVDKVKELENNYYELIQDIRKLSTAVNELRIMYRQQSRNNITTGKYLYMGKYFCPLNQITAKCKCESCDAYKNSADWCGNMNRPANECNCEFHSLEFDQRHM